MKVDKDSKLWAGIGYMCIALTLFGQIIMGYSYIMGQASFMISNVLFLIRTFALDRPIADKVKDICFTAVTGSLIIWYCIQ
jgi:hypothetical protein